MNDEAIKRVRTKYQDEIQVIVLSGRLTYDLIEDFKREMKEIIGEAAGYVIDLKDVEQIDSTGLGLLINIAKHFIFNKNKMVILNQDEVINELFEISKLNRIFNICPTMNEAIKVVTEDDEAYWSRLTSY